MLGTVPSASHASFHLMLTITLMKQNYPHFVDEETEAQEVM